MKQEEKYANHKFNNQALLRAIQQGTEENPNQDEALTTHMQVMDSYREGTIETGGHLE